MKTGLQLKLAQHLTLTPQLQQSIRLLQLSTLELQQEITAALAENPLLELEDGDESVEVSIDTLDAPAEFEQVLGGSDDYRDSSASEANSSSDNFDNYTSTTSSTSDAAAEATDATTETADADFGDAAESGEALDFSEWGSGAAGDGDENGEWQRAKSVSLCEHLRDQVAMVRAPEAVTQTLMMLIDAIDEDGMLTIDLPELAVLVNIDEATLRPHWERAITLLHAFDPPGVGARSLQECLLLQLRELRTCASVASANRIVKEAFDALCKRDHVRIRKLIGLNDSTLREALTVIQSLTPRPGAPFSDVSASQLVPDIIVRRNKTRWVPELNAAVVPKLAVNSVYANMLQREKEGRATPLSTQLQEARWLVKNVAQRFETILRVANEIVERQQAFFDHGAVAMRPLVLREVADALGLHESTVSRVTTQKYLTSIRGTFEFKYFFGSHVSTDAGGAASSTAIRSMIKTLISEEAPTQPLTDSRIAELLSEQGIIVARRTVAKYREQQNIDPVNLRKRE
jgi:RNA polymerase sigma-54 factor